MFAQAVAVAADVHDWAVVERPVDELCSHDLVAKDLAPPLETLVAREARRGMLVAPGDDLEEEHRADARDRCPPTFQIPYFPTFETPYRHLRRSVWRRDWQGSVRG